MFSDDDNLGIYDDLDEFQQAEDHKSKELLAWEAKHRNALTEIEDLKAQNKALGKKIKTMEVNLQNLLETAKSEVKRKEALICQLRKDKDDICFRRKRGREVEDPGEKVQENKRMKSVSKVEPEVKKNPFKADFKNDTKPVEKRRSRSKSPGLSHQKATERRPKIQDHGSEARQKSRERRRSRSRSPRHSSRHEKHRSRGSSFRPSKRKSCSPSSRDQVAGSKSHKMTSPFGEDPTKSGRRQHHENAKKIAAPSTPIELYTPEMAPKKTQVLSIECEDTSAVDGYFPGSTAFQPNSLDTGDCVPVFEEAKAELIPGLDGMCDLPAQNRETSEGSKIDATSEAMLPESVAWDLISVQDEEPAEEHLQVDPTAIDFSRPAKESLIRNTNCEHEPISRDEINDVDKSEPNHSFNKLTKDHSTVQAEVNAQLLAGTVQRDEGGSIAKPESECCDVGVRIIEDIRLPEVADIGHIAVIVDRLCDGLEEVRTKSASDGQGSPSDRCHPHDSNKALSELMEPTTPSTSNVLYAQPDSTKVDAENEGILEAAMNLLMGSDLVPPPPSAPMPSYPNLSLEEDAIEKTLGQLHQTSPDETVVTSTSNRARKAESHSPSLLKRPVIEKTPPKMGKPNDSQLTLVTNVLQLEELPPPSQDITIDETIDGECSANEDLSTVTKRCSLGHTDYQFEQRNDEIILRVKRRIRRRCPIPVDRPNPPPAEAK